MIDFTDCPKRNKAYAGAAYVIKNVLPGASKDTLLVR